MPGQWQVAPRRVTGKAEGELSIVDLAIAHKSIFDQNAPRYTCFATAMVAG